MAADDEAIDDAVRDWAEAFAPMRTWTGAQPGDERRATEALANFWSGAGLIDHLPWEVMHLLIEATEVGYLLALHDVRDGDHDDHLGITRE